MAVGLGNRLALRVPEEAADIVHLQADAMAQPVREEHRADAFLDHGFRAHVDDAVVLQHAGQHQVCLQVQLAIVLARAHLAAQGLLHLVDAVDQVLEVRGARRRVGAGDVAGVAEALGAGIDQQRAAFARAAMRSKCM